MNSFYFYDLETTSGNPRGGRIMQFAGVRTNNNLEIIGEPHDLLIKISDDIIPEPDAILVHGITPQQTLSDGITEAEFAELFHEDIAKPGTVFVGYNNIRFDDEFLRRLFYRNFCDPYTWHWKDGRGRWDLLDPIRMMRALRPDGLRWPFLDNKPTVKLEEMAKSNSIEHINAHTAISDVKALVELARKFKHSQPRLFDFLVELRDKKTVQRLVNENLPFIYTSGKYDSDFLKTTVVKNIFNHPRKEASIVYDLRYSPEKWLNKTPEVLAEHWLAKWDSDLDRLPIKILQYNRCPAIAPLSVLDFGSKKRIGYNDEFNKNLKLLENNENFLLNLKKALDILENEQQAKLPIDMPIEERIYDGFWDNYDLAEIIKIRSSDPAELSEIQKLVKNKRIRDLIPPYKARNYPDLMTVEEKIAWDESRKILLLEGGKKSKISRFVNRMEEIAKSRKLSSKDEYLLAELQLYVESIIPELN